MSMFSGADLAGAIFGPIFFGFFIAAGACFGLGVFVGWYFF